MRAGRLAYRPGFLYFPRMTNPTFSISRTPEDRLRGNARNGAIVLGFSLIIAVAAQIAIPLPFTPVPVSLQTLAVLSAGALLGKRRGLLCVLLYIAEGCAGLPVFSAGRAGIAHLLGPTGGYILGFAPSAFIAGILVERGSSHASPTLRMLIPAAGMLAGSAVVYIPGLLRLGAFVGFDKVWSLGLLPFLPGDLLKIAAGCAILWGRALVRKPSVP